MKGEVKLLLKFKKKIGGGGRLGPGGGSQGGCEQGSEAFCGIFFFFFFLGGVGSGGWGRLGEVRMDVNGEVKFL